MKWLAIGATVFLLGIGSAVAQPPPATYAPIPPPQAEVVPPLPGPGMVWERGHWHWNGGQYVWIAGRYVVRGPHYARYVDGHWRWGPRVGRYIWVPAHWQ